MSFGSWFRRLSKALVRGSFDEKALRERWVDAAIDECWIVGSQAAGDWVGMRAIAVYEGFGRAFVTPTKGMMAWIENENAVAVWNGGWSIGWPVRQFELASTPVVSSPVSGTTAETELRQSFTALLSGLQKLG